MFNEEKKNENEIKIWSKKRDSDGEKNRITNIVFHFDIRFVRLLDSMANLHAFKVAHKRTHIYTTQWKKKSGSTKWR